MTVALLSKRTSRLLRPDLRGSRKTDPNPARQIVFNFHGGFSLVEVIIVVVILAILATLLAPRVMGRTDDAKRAAAKAQIKNIESALQLYKLDNGMYPSKEQGLKALIEKPNSAPAPSNWKAGGYLAKLPPDPWGNPYGYTTPAAQGDFEVVSFGADGTPGGEGKNADLVNWNLDKN